MQHRFISFMTETTPSILQHPPSHQILSFVGNILWHAHHEKILILFGTLAFHIRDHKEVFDVCIEASPQLFSANLNFLATWYPNFTLYLPFFVEDQAKTSCTIRLLKGTWRIALASYGWNKAQIQSVSHWWFCQSIKSETLHSQISSSSWKRTLFVG